MARDLGIGKGPIGNGPAAFVIVVFTCIAVYNVIELTFIIWCVFHRHSGIYFWSFVVATYGVLVYSAGFLLKNVGPQGQANSFAYASVIAVGWVCMVTGQSMVLWSRLHLVLRDPFKLKLVLWMIIVNAVAMHTPTIIFLFGSSSAYPQKWVGPYGVYEKIQVTVFFLQEVIISSIYIVETTKLSRVLSVMRTKRRSRRLRNHLIVINVVIIILDIVILALEYARQYSIQTAYKALVYSIKLKMEFTILNRLVEMTTGHRDPSFSDQTSSGARRSSARASTAEGAHVYHYDGAYPRHTGAAADLPFPPPMARNRQPSVAYEAHAYSWNDSQYELPRDNSSSTANNNVVLTTEIVVKHEQRPTSQGNQESGSSRRGAVEDQDALSTSSSDAAPQVEKN